VKIIYRPGKDNINADALSCLTHLRSKILEGDDNEGVYGFIVTITGISASTLKAFEEGYSKDKHFSLIYENIKKKLAVREAALVKDLPSDTVLPFHTFEQLDKLAPDEIEYNGFQARLCHGHILLYIIDPVDNHPRLCVPSSYTRPFFEAAHDNTLHAGFDKAYKSLRPNYYIKNLTNTLRIYIHSCPSCQRNNIARYKPYGLL
jgi:hypothetical protein